MKYLALAAIAMIFSGLGRADFDQDERLRKFDLALNTLGIEPEAAPDYSDFPSSGEVNYVEMMTHMKAVDPEGGLRKYLQIDATHLSFLNGSTEVEYDLPLTNSQSFDSRNLIDRLGAIALQVKSGASLPLMGFKVVIDPGHMGSPEWDNVDGKFMSYNGKVVREGDLNLSTALLLANELETLGADVKVTRTTLEPVTPYTLTNFDPTEQRAIYFYKSLDSWMAKYLTLSDAELKARIKQFPEVTKVHSAAYKDTLYLQEDLNARMKMVEDFEADLFIGLHLDASNPKVLQNVVNDSEVYVPGAMGANETGSRLNRARGLKHLLEVRRWNQSVRLATVSVRNVARNLKIPMMTTLRIPSTVKVADGVFARNLFQTNRADKGLCIFFESLHYDHVKEFPVLAIKDQKSNYHGTDFAYPGRLTSVSKGITEGVLTYFKEFSAE
jgi:N-acetylmuramoyl-L-alanine amidase